MAHNLLLVAVLFGFGVNRQKGNTMKKYKLRATITVSAWTEVEAESRLEAFRLAEDRTVAWRDDGGATPDEEWIVEELDGEPMNIEVDGI